MKYLLLLIAAGAILLAPAPTFADTSVHITLTATVVGGSSDSPGNGYVGSIGSSTIQAGGSIPQSSSSYVPSPSPTYIPLPTPPKVTTAVPDTTFPKVVASSSIDWLPYIVIAVAALLIGLLVWWMSRRRYTD